MPKQKNKISFVALDLDHQESYAKLKAIEKIDLIKKRIHQICRILKESRPHSTWIIAWREYGVRERNTNSISNKIKIYFKREMKQISETYPNLVILAGTTLVRKKKNPTYIDKIYQFYKDIEWADEIEEKNDSQQVRDHKKDLKCIKKKVDAGELSKIRVTSNKARVYFKGIEKKHGKTTPFEENNCIENAVYQPGKGNNLNPIFEIHQKAFNLSIGIDICREHIDMFQYVKYFVETEKNHNKPLLHFIISASINLHLESISASYAAVHVDKKYKPRVVLSRGYEKQNIELESFSCDVMNPIFKLGKPISPEYPPQFKLLDKIDEMQRLKIISDKALDRFREDLTRRGDWLTDSQLKRLIDKQSFPLALRNKLHAIVDTNTTPYKYLNDKNSMFSINGGLKTKLETSTTECKRIKIAR